MRNHRWMLLCTILFAAMPLMAQLETVELVDDLGVVPEDGVNPWDIVVTTDRPTKLILDEQPVTGIVSGDSSKLVIGGRENRNGPAVDGEMQNGIAGTAMLLALPSGMASEFAYRAARAGATIEWQDEAVDLVIVSGLSERAIEDLVLAARASAVE
jgi:hypothetical protein